MHWYENMRNDILLIAQWLLFQIKKWKKNIHKMYMFSSVFAKQVSELFLKSDIATK